MKLNIARRSLPGLLIVALASTAFAQKLQMKTAGNFRVGKAGSKNLTFIPPIGSAKLYRLDGTQRSMQPVTVSPNAADKRVKFLYRAFQPPLLAFKKPGAKVRVWVLAQVSSKPFPTQLGNKASIYLGAKHGLVQRMTVGATPMRSFRVDFGRMVDSKPVFKVNRRYYVRVIPVWRSQAATYFGTPSNVIQVYYGHVLHLKPHDRLIPKRKPMLPPVEIPQVPRGIK